MLRRVAAFCRPLRPVLLLVSFPRSRGPVVGVLGLCWMWWDVPFARQRRPVVGRLRVSSWRLQPTPTRAPPPPPPAPPPLQRARNEWRRAQKILLQRTTGKSPIGELAPMALCDIHVPGCGEHLPAWGLRDDRIPGTDQAIKGGRHGQKLHWGFPPRGRGMPAAVRMPACHSRRFKGREANRRCHRLTEPTTKALCQPSPPCPRQPTPSAWQSVPHFGAVTHRCEGTGPGRTVAGPAGPLRPPGGPCLWPWGPAPRPCRGSGPRSRGAPRGPYGASPTSP